MYNKIVEYAANTLGISADEIDRDTTFKSLGLDSLDIVEMIEDLESELDVEINLENQDITTIGELADYIEDQLN